ncbi:MAG: hypothetical protein ACXQS9_00940 [Methermicoccaceae archaeon]
MTLGMGGGDDPIRGLGWLASPYRSYSFALWLALSTTRRLYFLGGKEE